MQATVMGSFLHTVDYLSAFYATIKYW